MLFAHRRIEVTFQLGQTTLGGSAAGATSFSDGSDTVTVKGLRVSAVITKAGTPAAATLSMQVYGMRLETMNKLSTLGLVYAQIKRNTVTVKAGNEGETLAVAFKGTVMQAWIDFNMPNVALHIEAQTLGAETTIASDPTSINGSADVAQLMEGFATKMGLTFKNSGINARVANPYYYGSLPAQAQACATAAGINWFVDNGVLSIWKKTEAAEGTVPLIAPPPKGGMVGYPSFTAYGIALKMIFNPDVKFGGDVKVESSLEGVSKLNTTGIWTIYNIDHEIDSQVPNGKWFTNLTCFNKKFPRAVTT